MTSVTIRWCVFFLETYCIWKKKFGKNIKCGVTIDQYWCAKGFNISLVTKHICSEYWFKQFICVQSVHRTPISDRYYDLQRLVRKAVNPYMVMNKPNRSPSTRRKKPSRGGNTSIRYVRVLFYYYGHIHAPFFWTVLTNMILVTAAQPVLAMLMRPMK